MSINLKIPDIRELKPRITVFGVGGAGGNAVNNMITAGLQGVDFVVANTDAQALTMSKAERIIQMGVQVTEGLGAGSQPEVGRAAAEEVIDEIRDHLTGAHMVFVTAGMGGGTGTGAAPVIARVAKEMGILTVGVVTKPFQFEGERRMRIAEAGITELQKCVDTLIIIPNQNLFRVANEKTTFADAFAMADQVLYSGVACITDLMVKEGLINLDFADVRAVMREMGKAMMGTGEASGEKRALRAAEAAIANPLIDDVSMKGARGLLISITGGKDLTLYEVDEAATRIREEVDQDANIIVGATFDESLEGIIRVSVVATGIDHIGDQRPARTAENRARGTHAASCAPTRSASPTERAERAGAAVRLPAQRRRRLRPRCGRRSTAPRSPPRSLPPTAIEDVTIRPIAAEAVAVRRADAWPSPRRRTTPEGLHPAAAGAAGRAARACRGSTNCRCRRRTRSAPSAAKSRRTDPEKQRMSLLQRLASVGLGRREDEASRRRRAPQRRRPSAALPPLPQTAGRSAGRRIRCRNTPSGRRAGPAGPRPARPAGSLCISLWRTISSKSRPSCAARPTDAAAIELGPVPAALPGSRLPGAACAAALN